MLHNLKQNPHKSSLRKQAFQTKTPLSFYFFIGATKYYSILLFLLPAGGLVCEGWEWQRVTDWENLFQNPSPYEVHACMNSPIPLVWNPSLNLLLWNPWIYWYEILESTDVKSLNPPIWILDRWWCIWRGKKKWTRRRRKRRRRRRSSISCMHHSIAQKLQPNSSRAICPPPPSLPPWCKTTNEAAAAIGDWNAHTTSCCKQNKASRPAIAEANRPNWRSKQESIHLDPSSAHR